MFIKISKNIHYCDITGNPFSLKKNGFKELKASTKEGYRKLFFNGKDRMWQQVVYEFFSGNTIPSGYRIHFKDFNNKNNLYSNLDLKTDRLNSAMVKKKKNNSCGYPGVSYANGSIVVRIRVNGKLLFFSNFYSKEEAYQKYLKLKIEYHSAKSIAKLP